MSPYILSLVLIVFRTITTFSTKSNDQTYHQLQREDAVLNMTRATAQELMILFLSTGNISIGEEAWNLTQEYAFRKRLWTSKTQNYFKNITLSQGNEIRQMETCLADLQEVLQIAAAANSLYQNISNVDFNTNASSIQTVQQCSRQLKLFEYKMTELQKRWKSCNITFTFEFPWISILRDLENKQQYLVNINETIYIKQLDTRERLELTQVFRYYAYPIVYTFILVIGTIGNGTLFFIFLRHREVRTNANIMVLNLAVADVLNLFVNAPVYYMIKYHNELMYVGCKAFAIFRFLIHALIELSVVAISCQRYFATVSAVNIGNKNCTLTARTRIIVHITVVWILSLIIALFPVLFVFDFPNGICYPIMRYENWAEVFYISTFLFDCVFLPISLFTYSVLTARILNRSAREMPSELRNSDQELARYRSAKVVTALAIAYIICIIPRCVLSFVISFHHLDRDSKIIIYLDEITNYFIFSNSCINPIALYMASQAFRRLFNRYLFPCYKVSQKNNHSGRFTEFRNTSEIRISEVIDS